MFMWAVLTGLYFNAHVIAWINITAVYFIFQNDIWQMGSLVYQFLRYCYTGNGMLASIIGLLVEEWSFWHLWGVYMLEMFINLWYQQTFNGAVKFLRRFVKNYIIQKLIL